MSWTINYQFQNMNVFVYRNKPACKTCSPLALLVRLSLAPGTEVTCPVCKSITRYATRKEFIENHRNKVASIIKDLSAAAQAGISAIAIPRIYVSPH